MDISRLYSQDSSFKAEVTRSFSINLDIDHPELAVFKMSSKTHSIHQALVSPSGDSILLNVGGCILCLLDSHSLQILAINFLMTSDKLHLESMHSICFLSDSTFLIADTSNCFFVWSIDGFKLTLLSKINLTFEVTPEAWANIIMDIYLGNKANQILDSNRLVGKFQAHEKTEFRYFDLFDFSASSSLQFEYLHTSSLEDLRQVKPTLLVLADGDSCLHLKWLEPIVCMFGDRFEADRKQSKRLLGNSISTDKLIQYIREHSHKISSTPPIVKDSAGLLVNTQGKQPAAMKLVDFGLKRVLVLLFINLELMVLDFDLMVCGFMEHLCFKRPKK